MPPPRPHPWPFFLAALVLLGASLVFYLAAHQGILGSLFVAFAVLSAAFGWHFRPREPIPEFETAPTSSPPPQSGSERSATSTEYYGDEKAVRSSMEKPKRLCAECRSPVLETALECPTCSTPLA